MAPESTYMDAGAFIPPPGFSRETTIRRDAEGRWSQDGVLLEHEHLVRAFDRWVDRAEDGRLCLKNELGWAYVTIEGAPLFVRSLRLDAMGAWIRLSDDREERLDVRTLRVGPDGALYCDARGGGLAARFARDVQAGLADVVGGDEGGVFLLLGGEKIYPVIVVEPLLKALPSPSLKGGVSGE